jgi:transformation/transcription domain-associated protein
MPLVWLIDNCYLFIRSVMSILVSVSGEISSGAIDLAQEILEKLVRISLVSIESLASDPENEFYKKLAEQQRTVVEEILKELIRQVNIN